MSREFQTNYKELNKIYTDDHYAYVNLDEGIYIKTPKTNAGMELLHDAMQNINALFYDLRKEKLIFVDYEMKIDTDILISTNYLGDENNQREATEEEYLMFAMG